MYFIDPGPLCLYKMQSKAQSIHRQAAAHRKSWTTHRVTVPAGWANTAIPQWQD